MDISRDFGEIKYFCKTTPIKMTTLTGINCGEMHLIIGDWSMIYDALDNGKPSHQNRVFKIYNKNAGLVAEFRNYYEALNYLDLVNKPIQEAEDLALVLADWRLVKDAPEDSGIKQAIRKKKNTAYIDYIKARELLAKLERSAILRFS